MPTTTWMRFIVPTALWCLTMHASVSPSPAVAQDPPAEARAGDRAAVEATLESFVKAFESRDPAALAGHWTSGAEYHNLDGVTVQGREALEKGFAAYFDRTPEVSAELHPESLRFLADGAAVAEGSVTVRRGPVEPATRARYSALLLREDGRWRIAELTESPDDGDSVEDLAWLIGEWRSETGQGAEIRTSYSWAPNHKFIHAQFTIKEESLALSGFQVIGLDPATEALHTWTFERDGGVGEADWSRDGDHWVLDAVGSLTDGRTLTEVNVLRRIDDDTFTWQSIERVIDDEAMSDLAPVKVTRVKAK
jgi:uncharacterized protein (TIGR02246 family)